MGGRAGRGLAIGALLGLLLCPKVSSSGETATTVEIMVSSTILLNGAYGPGSPHLAVIEGITAFSTYSGVSLTSPGVGTGCALNATVVAAPTGKFVLFDQTREPWHTASPCYWQHATDTAAHMGAVAVVASLHEGANHTYTDVMTPDGPADGSQLAIPLVFVSRRDAAVLWSYLNVFPTLNMRMECPSCKPVTSGQRDDGNPWLYPLVFAGTMLVLLVAAITMMWATLRPLPQIHPIDMRDHEDAEVAVVLSLARQNSMETALGRMSPSVPFSNTGEHMEAKGDADSADGLVDAAPVVKLDDQTTCAVCIDDFSEGAMVRALRCGHVFHSQCIDPWLLDRRTCPLCKAEILVEECTLPELEEGGDGLHQLSYIFLNNALMAMEQLYTWQSQQPRDRQDSARRSARESAASIVEDYEALLQSAEQLTWLQEQAQAARALDETWTPIHAGASDRWEQAQAARALDETWTPMHVGASDRSLAHLSDPLDDEVDQRGQGSHADGDDGDDAGSVVLDDAEHGPPAYSWA